MYGMTLPYVHKAPSDIWNNRPNINVRYALNGTDWDEPIAVVASAISCCIWTGLVVNDATKECISRNEEIEGLGWIRRALELA